MTSIHDGLSCDACKESNFSGLRYKCLVCYNYDLCARCHDSGHVSSRHKTSHPMQCMVARDDYELFYQGETTLADRPYSYTCPLCNQLGFSESSLIDHVHIDHSTAQGCEDSAGVVCPICGLDSNQLTYDFAMHLSMEHRSAKRSHHASLATDSQHDGSTNPLQNSIPIARNRGTRSHVRGSMPRVRRSQMQYNPFGASSSSPNQPTIRESTGSPVTDIVSQIPGVRLTQSANGYNVSVSTNNIASTAAATAAQLNQLQMQLQSSPGSTSDREVRIIRRTLQSLINSAGGVHPPAPLQPSAILSGMPSRRQSRIPTISHNVPPVDLRAPLIFQQNMSRESPSTLDNMGSHLNDSSQGFFSAPFTYYRQQAAAASIAPQAPIVAPLTQNRFLLPECLNSLQTEADHEEYECLRADRSLFVQDLLLQLGSIEDQSRKI